LLDRGHHLAGVRADDVAGSTVGRVDPLAPDEHLVTVRHVPLLSGSTLFGSEPAERRSGRQYRAFEHERTTRRRGPRAAGLSVLDNRVARSPARAYGRGIGSGGAAH